MAAYAYEDDDRADRRRRRRGWEGWPCFIYVRISATTEKAVRKAMAAATDQERADALHEKVLIHLAECQRYARDEGMEVIDSFMEENRSASAFRGMAGGKIKTLPARDALMSRLAGWDSDVVVLTTEIERLYRDVGESLSMEAEADRLNNLAEGRGHALHIVTTSGEDHDLTTAQGRYNFHVGAAVGARESARTSERRRRSQRDRTAAGLYSFRRPFGYEKVLDAGRPTGALTIREDEAGLIRAAAARILAEAAEHPERSPSLHAIAREWDDAGVRTAYTRRVNGELEHGHWSGTELARMLRNRLYAPHPDDPSRGILVHREGNIAGKRAPRRSRGTEAPGQWPPILDRETHERVTAILADPRRKTRAGGGGRPARYVLTAGLAVCGLCGRPLHAARYADDAVRRILKCPSAPQGCGGVARSMGQVEDFAREVALYWLRKGGPYEAYLKAQREASDAGRDRSRLAEIGAQLAGLAGQIAEWTDRIDAG